MALHLFLNEQRLLCDIIVYSIMQTKKLAFSGNFDLFPFLNFIRQTLHVCVVHIKKANDYVFSYYKKLRAFTHKKIE